MSRAVPVTKLHGTRNDFVLLDERQSRVSDYATLARFVCDRHAGIGADGLLVVLPSQTADVRMRIFNADGSEAQMCGNGIRCVARYLHEAGGESDLRVETLWGTVPTYVVRAENGRYDVRVELGRPRIEAANGADSVEVWLGNPHVVLFPKALEEIDLEVVGPRLCSAAPAGTNVHAAVPNGPHGLTVRHWERGVGMTLACGTGAAAAAAAAIFRGDVRSPVEVSAPGGRLIVAWDGAHDVSLTGPTVRVFDTEIGLPETPAVL